MTTSLRQTFSDLLGQRPPTASHTAERWVYGLPPLLDLLLLGAVAILWFTPVPILLAGFPLLLVFWWRRRLTAPDAAATPLDVPIYLFVGLGILALIPSPNLETSLTRLLGLWLGIAVYYAVLDSLVSEKKLWVTVAGLAFIGMGLAIVGPLLVGESPDGQATRLSEVSQAPALDLLRALVGDLHPNKLAAALAMLMPLPAAVLLFTPGRMLRLIWGAGTLLIATALLLTESRSGLLAATVALLALAVLRSPSSALILPLIAWAAIGITGWIGPYRVAEDLLALTIVPGTEPSLRDRLDVWSAALTLIGQSPLLGIGIGAFPEAVEHGALIVRNGAEVSVPHAHNLYLQYALDLGVPGLAAFVLLLVGVFRLTRDAVRLGPTARARGLTAGVAAGLLAYLTYGLTDAIGPGEKPGLFFWLLVGIVAAGGRLAVRGPRVDLPVAGRNGRSALVDRQPIGSVIYISTFDWSYHTARPQQLARALAERVPVLYVEATGLRGVGTRDLRRLLRRLRRVIIGRHRPEFPRNLWVFSPLVLPLHGSRLARAFNRMLLRDAVLGQARDLGLRNPLLLISIPNGASIDLLGHLDEVASIYDCMDDLTVVPMLDRSVAISEAELASQVDVMVAASDELRRIKADLRPDIAVVGQGVDLDHFSKPAVCPADLAALPSPRLVFVGGVDDRVDFALLDEVARQRPDWSIVMIGPQLYVDADALVRSPNIHMLGRRAYGELPGYLQAADVCLIPYRDTAWAQACNPVKTLEYLAAGKPVVSTPLPAVLPYAPVVRIAATAPEMVAAVEAALAEDGATARDARRALAATASWHDRAETLLDLAAHAVKHREESWDRVEVASP